MPFTDEDRQKALDERRDRQRIRRQKAKEMYDAGMQVTKIARVFGVNYRTISRDLKKAE